MQDARQQAQAEETTVARGRPRAFDREAALAEATRLFWSKGYEATSIAEPDQGDGDRVAQPLRGFRVEGGALCRSAAHYRDNFETLFWGNFDGATSAREAVLALLMDFGSVDERLSRRRSRWLHGGAVLGCQRGPRRSLAALVHAARAGGLERLKARIERAIAEGELRPRERGGARPLRSYGAKRHVGAGARRREPRRAGGCGSHRHDGLGRRRRLMGAPASAPVKRSSRRRP